MADPITKQIKGEGTCPGGPYCCGYGGYHRTDKKEIKQVTNRKIRRINKQISAGVRPKEWGTAF